MQTLMMRKGPPAATIHFELKSRKTFISTDQRDCARCWVLSLTVEVYGNLGNNNDSRGIRRLKVKKQSKSNLLVSSVWLPLRAQQGRGESEKFSEPRTSPSPLIGQPARVPTLIGPKIWGRWGLEVASRLPRIGDDENCWCWLWIKLGCSHFYFCSQTHLQLTGIDHQSNNMEFVKNSFGFFYFKVVLGCWYWWWGYSMLASQN